MAKIKISRGSQYPLFKTQIISFDDFFVTGTNPATQGANFGAGAVTVPLTLPVGARIVSGAVFVDTPFTGGTAFTIDIGEVGTPQKYLAAQSVFTAPANEQPILLPNYANINGNDITILGNATGVATAGKIAVVVGYIIDNRISENQIV